MTPLTTKDIPLSQAQKQWYEATCKKIDLGRLKQLIFDLTTKHSPTGAEREACEFMADYLNGVGIKAHYQPITDISGNCYGRAKGSGDGPTLMLYAPIDTLLEGDPEKDTPHAGPEHRADMLPEPYIDGDLVIGLGASNPKSMIALLIEALACVVEAEVDLKGDAIIATAGGGMPWIVPERNHAGISNGVNHLLSHGVTADFGVICKPYPGAPLMAGQTDAATINRTGFPLVRIGYTWLGEKDMPAEFTEGLGGMGVACIPDLENSIKEAIYTVIDSCTRTRAEVGLKN